MPPVSEAYTVVPTQDTATMHSSVGGYLVHQAVITSASSGTLQRPSSWLISVRDKQARDRQVHEDSSHRRCPAEGFSAPGARPLTHAPAIALIADNHFLVYKYKKMLQMITARGDGPDLLLHLGDGVQHGYSEREWLKDFLWPLTDSGLVPGTPVLMARGNHDTDKGTADTEPALSPSQFFHAGREVTVADLRIIVLDTTAETKEQLVWLRGRLNNALHSPAATIICGHIPPFIEYWEPTVWAAGESSWDVYMRTRVIPVVEDSVTFRQGRLKMVLGGHSHIYQRGERNGVQYVIMGGGGAQLESPAERVANHSMYSVTRFEHHYAWLDRRYGRGSSSRSTRGKPGGLNQDQATWDWRFRVFSIHNRLLDEFAFNVTPTVVGTGG